MDWTLASMIAAGLSAVANGAAASVKWRRRRRHEFVLVHFARFAVIAAASFFYVGAFGWLRFGDVDRGDWSRAMTPFAVVVFFAVWAAPAVVAVIEDRHWDHRLGRTVDGAERSRQ